MATVEQGRQGERRIVTDAEMVGIYQDEASRRTTQHTCGGPVFGRRTPGCPRCDELAGGAAPVVWANSTRQDDEQRCREIRSHFSSPRHLSGGCGLVCTFGEW